MPSTSLSPTTPSKVSKVSKVAARPRRIMDYAISRRLGGGLGSQVYQARDVVTEREVALKVIPKPNAHIDLVRAEQDIQAALDRQAKAPSFLLPLLTSFHDEENFYLVTEYFGGLDLASHIGGATRFEEGRVRQLAAELVVTLEQLREARIIHRDIKPANILFTGDGHLRLTDFGLSKRFSASEVNLTATDVLGTPGYMAGTVHKGEAYSYEVDLHAAGVIIYQMATLRLPFGGRTLSPVEMRASVLNDPVNFRRTDRVSPALQSLLRGMMAQGKGQLTLQEVKAHPYFHNVPWKAVTRQTMVMDWHPRLARSSGRFTSPPVKCGASYLGRDDPYPDFNYVSPRLLVQRKLPGPAQKLSRSLSSVMDTVTRRNVMPPTKSIKPSVPGRRVPVVFERSPSESSASPVKLMTVAPALDAPSLRMPHRRPASNTAASLLATPKASPAKSPGLAVSQTPTTTIHPLEPVTVAWPSPTPSDASTVESPAPERCVKPKDTTDVVRRGNPTPSRTSSRPPLAAKTNEPGATGLTRHPTWRGTSKAQVPTSRLQRRSALRMTSSAKENIAPGKSMNTTKAKAKTTKANAKTNISHPVARKIHIPQGQNELSIGKVCEGPSGRQEVTSNAGPTECDEEGSFLLSTTPMELDPTEAMSKLTEVDSLGKLAASPVKIDPPDCVSPLDRMLAELSLDTSVVSSQGLLISPFDARDTLDDVDDFPMMTPLPLDPLDAKRDLVEIEALATRAETPAKVAIPEVVSPLQSMLAQLALSVELSVSETERIDLPCSPQLRPLALVPHEAEVVLVDSPPEGIECSWRPSVAEAFALPPCMPKEPHTVKRNSGIRPLMLPALVSARTPVVPPPPSIAVGSGLRPFILGSHTITREAQDKRYNSPSSLTATNDNKTHLNTALARARSEVYERAKDGNITASTVSPSVSSRWTAAMHYDGGLPVSSDSSTSDGLSKSVRRHWIHVKMACGRLRARATATTLS